MLETLVTAQVTQLGDPRASIAFLGGNIVQDEVLKMNIPQLSIQERDRRYQIRAR